MDMTRLPTRDQNNVWYRYNHADAVLVFVHGVLSDSRSCWLSQDKKTGQSHCYWPELIASDARFKDIAIYLSGYHTAVDSGDFPIQQCALEVFSYLKTSDASGHPPVMDKPKITFVCHSMGGIVARYLLCEQRDAFREKQVGIVLIASPSYGSQLPHSLDWIIYLYNHRQGKQLIWSDEILQDLDQRFKNLKESKHIPHLSGVELFENRFVLPWKWLPWKWLPWFKRTKVVTEESAARYFGYAKQVGGSDHNSICKPQAKEDCVHQYLLEFLQDKALLPSQTLPVIGTNAEAAAEGDAPAAPAISRLRAYPSSPESQPVLQARDTPSVVSSAETERARTERIQAETTAQFVTYLIKQNELLTTQGLHQKKAPSPDQNQYHWNAESLFGEED
jgi:pimeloyl-ACP methyl ester carboxylesterase